MRLVLIGTVMLALAGCSPANQTPNDAVAANDAAEPAEAVNYVAEIDNLSEAGRQGVFLGAIRDANISCRDVTTIERLEDRGGLPTWRAQCDQGAQHLIQVQPDGTAKVTSRVDP